MTYQVSAGQMYSRDFYPIPCKGKRPLIPDWNRVPIDDQQVVRWAEQYPEENIGVRGLGAIDLDVYDPVIAGQMVEFIRALVPGTVLVRYGQRPKALIPCRLASDVKNKIHSTGYRAPGTTVPVSKIEILGKGSQWIAEGIHPDTGQAYEWEGGQDLCTVWEDDLPLVTNEQISRIFEKYHQLCDEYGLEACLPMNQKSMDRPVVDGKELDPRQPGDDFSMRANLLEMLVEDGWVDTGEDVPRVRHYTLPDGSTGTYRYKQRLLIRPNKAINGDPRYPHSGNVATIGGVQLFYNWSTSVPGLPADRAYTAHQYYGFTKHGEDFNATARDLRRQGYGRVSAADDFDDLDARDPLEAMCGRNVLIAEGKRVVDLEVPHDGVMLTLDEFTCFTAHIRAGDAANSPPLARIWARDPRRKQARSVTYQPGGDVLVERGPNVYDYNTYHRPEWTYTKDRGLIEPIIEHYEYLLGDRNGPDFQWYLSWLSHMLHKPWERPTTTPLLISTNHGTGRGYGDCMIRQLLGDQNCSTSTMTDVARGQYQDHMADNIFCSIAEVKENRKAQYQINDEIRETLTAKRLFLNLKYGKKGDYQIYTRIHMTSNHRDCVVIPSEDRRIFVSICTKPQMPRAHYVTIYELLNDPAAMDQMMSYTLDHHRLVSWDATADAPMNEAKLSLIATGHNSVEQAFNYMLGSQTLPDVASFSQIYNYIAHELRTNDWFDGGGEEGARLHAQISALLRGKCASLGRKRLPGVERGNVWVLRNEQMWKDASPFDLAAEISRWPEVEPDPLRRTDHLDDFKRLLH